VGKVTDVVLVMVNVLANAPAVVKLPPRVIVLAPLLTPVPPLVPESVPVHPKVKDVACNKDVAGVPPRVKVTFVSSTFVNAAGVTVELVTH
jgi:hypothetical protein